MIETDVVALLNSATGITSIIGSDDIYPMIADGEVPYITYQVITGTRPGTLAKRSSNVRNVRMQFNCWGSTYEQSKDIANALIATLDTAIGLQCVMNLEQDDYDQQTKEYGQIVDYSIWQTATGS